MAEVDSRTASYFLESFFLPFTTRFGDRCVRLEPNVETIRHRIPGLRSAFSRLEQWSRRR